MTYYIFESCLDVLILERWVHRVETWHRMPVHIRKASQPEWTPLAGAQLPKSAARFTCGKHGKLLTL